MAATDKSVKRTLQLAPLSEEHHEGLLLVWRIYQGLKKNTEPGRIKDYILWYWENHIKPHFYQEEKILFPYLPAQHELGLRMHSEHERIKQMIMSLDDQSGKEIFVDLANFIEEHINFEEQELYAYLEQVLSKDQLDMISLQLAEHPVPASEWQDEFWKRVK